MNYRWHIHHSPLPCSDCQVIKLTGQYNCTLWELFHENSKLTKYYNSYSSDQEMEKRFYHYMILWSSVIPQLQTLPTVNNKIHVDMHNREVMENILKEPFIVTSLPMLRLAFYCVLTPILVARISRLLSLDNFYIASFVSIFLIKNMSDRVANWESVVQKTVRSSEGNLIGNVDAVDEKSILISTEGGRTRYKIPKHIVRGFDGHEVSLNVQKGELERFKGAADEGFREVK